MGEDPAGAAVPHPEVARIGIHPKAGAQAPAFGVGNNEGRQLPDDSGVEHVAEDHLEDAAMAVVVHLGGHVDPNRGRERDL